MERCRLRFLLGVCIPAVTVAAGCTASTRYPLISPFPLTYGGTPVPAAGVVVGLGLNDGLAGQELHRAEVRDVTIGFGVADRVALSFSDFSTPSDSFTGPPMGEAGTAVRANVRLGAPFGPRTSAAAHLAVGRAARVDGAAQNETVLTFDAALPVERLLTRPDARLRFSVYAGPRVTHESYRDHLDSRNDFAHAFVGGLGGLHVHYRRLHAFGEVTTLHVPANTYLGVRYGDRWTIAPACGVLFRFGRDHSWSPATSLAPRRH